MYIPSMYREDRVEVMQALMRERPFATLVAMGEDGPIVDHLPILLDAAADAPGILRGHVARANRLWRDCDTDREVTVVFHGPQAYVTPSWYPSKKEHGKVVPTWVYAVVHARGTIRFIEDAAWLRRLVDELTAGQEDDRPVPWAPSDAPEDYIEGMVKAIVGLEIEVTHLDGKWKMSQNQEEANRRGASRGLQMEPGTDAAAAAALVGDGLD